MAAPEGYTELGRIGFVDKGNYASGTTYRTGDVVYYNGSTWVALKDNLKGVTPAAGANWKYMARGFAAEALSAITAVDTSGVLGEAGASVTSQELIDAIADKVMTKLIEKSKIVNNLLATDATTVLSGPMGKSLDEKITQLNSDSVKKKQSQSINPDTIKWTDVRSLNGWDGSIQPYIPVELRNQWLSCVTTSPYDGANSEALCQILISADKAVHASRRMDNNGNWLPWQVSDLGALARIGSIEKIEFGYNSGTAGYEFVYIGFKVVNWATFQLRIFVQSNPGIKISLFKVENGTYTKMWDL